MSLLQLLPPFSDEETKAWDVKQVVEVTQPVSDRAGLETLYEKSFSGPHT